MLSRTILRRLANASSYSKGESYYHQECVRRIKRKGDTFAAKVEGSELYEVSMTLTPAGPEFTCSCPYDYDGICKHSVALGLAVLDEFGPDIELSEIQFVGPSSLTMDADTLWQKTTAEQRMNFLRQLLDKQPDLRMQLMQFARLAVAPQPAANQQTVDSVSTAIYEALSDLRFNDDTLEFDYDHYYDESPDPEPLITEVFEEYVGEVIQALREGRLTDAFTICLGVYEGCQSATEVEDDDYGVIGDYPSETWAVWNNLIGPEYTQLASRVVHADQIRATLDLLAERVQRFDETDEDHNELYYDLKAFEPLLLALVTDMPSARVVQQAIEQHQWQQRGTEYIQLHIADALRDPDLWLQTADQFADHDATIAGQLLARRQQMGDLPILLQLLHRFTKRFPNTFDEFILQHLDEKRLAPGPDLNLYLNALENRCRRLGQVPDYLKLREFWPESKRLAFAKSLPATQGIGYTTNSLFYAQVLHTEGRDAEVLAWLKSISWSYNADLPGILELMGPIYPKECLTQVSGHAINSLETGKRDRALYGMIASWLAALNTVPELKSGVSGFVRQLHANYPRLSALKDELKQRGLKI